MAHMGGGKTSGTGVAVAASPAKPDGDGVKSTPSPEPTHDPKSESYVPSPLVAAAQRAAASAAFFQPLLVPDEDLRGAALEDRLSALRVSALGDQTAVRAHLLTAVRLSVTAPFEDIREGFTAFLQFLHKETECSLQAAKAAQAVPSRIVDSDMLTRIDTEEEEVAPLLQYVFLTLGRVSHMHRVLAWHPSYLRSLVESDSAIMRDAAALPRPWRRYLAVMAAARHQCTPIIEAQAAAFVAEGGDAAWLEGLKYAPAQFANLAELNALIAHRPWLITRDHIAALVRGDGSWSVTELVTAMVVLTTMHAQSILVWGMGVESEVDLRSDTGVAAVSVTEASAPASADGTGAGSGAGAGASGTAAGAGSGAGTDAGAGGGAGAGSATERRRHVEYEEDLLKDRLMADLDKLMGETGDGDGDVYEQAGTAQISVESTKLPDVGVAHLCGHPLLYTNFLTSEHKVLKTQDYCWEDHGYSLVSRYFPSAAPLLDRQFQLTYDLTYETFSKAENIDTMPFRRAIWYYVHRIFGICNDDYDYREVNVFLPRAVKEYVKKVTCFPESVTKEDFDGFSATLGPDEKCHICLLALEARKQAGLLHGLQAVMKYMT